MRVRLRRIRRKYEISLERVLVTNHMRVEEIPEGTLRIQNEIIKTAFNILSAIKWKLRGEVNVMSVLLLINKKETIWISEIEQVNIEPANNIIDFYKNLEDFKYKFKPILRRKIFTLRQSSRHKRTRSKIISTTTYPNKYNTSFDISMLGTKLTLSSDITKCELYGRSIIESRNELKQKFKTVASFNSDFGTLYQHVDANRNRFKLPQHISITIPKANTLSQELPLDEFDSGCTPYKKFTKYMNMSTYNTKKKYTCRINKSLLVRCTNYNMENIPSKFIKEKH